MTFYNMDLSSQNSEQKSPTLSVSSLNRMAKGLLESNFPAIVVEGEVSNLATPASGHWYLTLKDKNSQIRCAMFAGRNRSVKFRPQNGNQVIIRGKLSIYEGRGDYQLIADSMEEEGDGALRGWGVIIEGWGVIIILYASIEDWLGWYNIPIDPSKQKHIECLYL